MNEMAYRHLLLDLSKHLNLPSSDRILSNGLLRINDMNVLVIYDAELDRDNLEIRFDLGMSPKGKREEFWLLLLNSNFSWGRGGRFVFSVIPENSHVVLTMQHLIVSRPSGEELANWLRAAAKEVKARWAEIINEIFIEKTRADRYGSHEFPEYRE